MRRAPLRAGKKKPADASAQDAPAGGDIKYRTDGLRAAGGPERRQRTAEAAVAATVDGATTCRPCRLWHPYRPCRPCHPCRNSATDPTTMITAKLNHWIA